MTRALPDELKLYPACIEIPIQWGDHDAFGHVNNTVPLRWFESARIALIELCGLHEWMRPGGQGPVLASITCHYRKQLFYPDKVLIGARMARIGRTSMHLAHAVYSQTQRQIAIDGEAVIVLFDFDRGRPVRIPPEVHELFERLQPKEDA